jgi:pre-mRNA-splicing factor CWC26
MAGSTQSLRQRDLAAAFPEEATPAVISMERRESPGKAKTDGSAAQGETVYRHRHGSRVDHRLEKLKKQRQESEQQEVEARRMEWGRGFVQRKEEERLSEELEELKSAPFARTRDDARLNELQKEKVRWDDPARNFAAAAKSEASGGSSQTAKERVPQKAPYGGYCPPNRFGIRPGHRWDGVDRSNGFEGDWFKAQAKKAARVEVAYKWRTEDM